MKLNHKKTKLMIFMPRFVVGKYELEVVEETMLLGVKLRSDTSWESNTEYIIKRANRKIWCLRRLKKLVAKGDYLVDVYCNQIRNL